MKITPISFDGCDLPPANALKFARDDANTIRMSENERAGAFRNGQRLHDQHVRAMTEARPGHAAIQLWARIERRAKAMWAEHPTMSFSEATQAVINANPRLLRRYQRAQRG